MSEYTPETLRRFAWNGNLRELQAYIDAHASVWADAIEENEQREELLRIALRSRGYEIEWLANGDLRLVPLGEAALAQEKPG